MNDNTLTDERQEELEHYRHVVDKMVSTEIRYGSEFHDSGSCWDLIEFMLTDIRELRGVYEELQEVGKELNETEAGNAKLRDALEKYGMHLHRCDHKTWIPGPKGRADGCLAGCTCGLDDALKEPDDE